MGAGSRLTPSERKIGEYLLRHPDEVIGASALRIAEATGTSDATVVRTVKGLGYSGLKEMKKEFLESVLRRRNVSATIDHRIDRMLMNEQPVLGMLSESVGVLDAFREEFDVEAFERSIDIMASARRIYAYGLGPGGMIAGFLALNLVRVGYDAHSITQTGYRLADDLLLLRDGDCVVLFAPYHQTAEVEVLVDHANKVGASVVLVTEALGPSLKDRVQVVIKTPSTISSLASEGLAPLTFSYAVTVQLASKHRDASVKRGELFTELSSRFTGSPEMLSPPFFPVDINVD
ncbi:MurR/RpiR family transcriptional regulator [Arthrobacter sp. S2(2024)]|uniref:MurR/RpiR family transcriptional regulator n=1 Tax=Arthrobacter sp. S2(2024) TaxID=3111911 RepID=UPI002FCBB0B8